MVYSSLFFKSFLKVFNNVKHCVELIRILSICFVYNFLKIFALSFRRTSSVSLNL